MPQIPGYTLAGKIGEGGMGAVWKATDAKSGRTVAVKILHPNLAQNKTYVDRFLREIRTALTLNHRNIVRGIEAGEAGGTYYYVMEYFEGEPLHQTIRRQGPLDEVWSLQVILQVLRGIEHAWKNGFVHRDIKPQNILVNRQNVAKITDLGLAIYQDDAALTQTGLTVGTPHYIAPERARGDKNQDIRIDLYSIGATLYHMVTGETLYSGGTSAEILAKQVTEPMPDPRRRRPDLNEWISDILAKALQKDPRDRYDDPTQMIDDLQALLDGNEPSHIARPAAVPRSPRAPNAPAASSSSSLKVILGVVVSLVILGLGLALMRSSTPAPVHKPPVVKEDPKKPPVAVVDEPAIKERTPEEKVSELLSQGKIDLALAEIDKYPGDPGVQKHRDDVQRKIADREFAALLPPIEATPDLDRSIGALRAKLESHRGNPFLVNKIEEKIAALESEKMRRARGGVKIDPEDQAVLVAARDKLDNNRADEAVDDLRKLLFKLPEHREAQLLLVKALLKSGKAEEALKQVDPMIAANPKDREPIDLRLEVSRSLHRSEEVARSLTLLIAATAPTADLLMQRATAYRVLKKTEETLKDLDQVIALDSKRIDAWQMKATIFNDSKQFAKAIDALSEILKIDPKDKNALYDRGLIRMQLNDLDPAEADFKQTLALDPQFVAAKERLKELEQRAKNPVRPASRTNAVPLFDGKTKNGWTPPASVKIDVKDTNLALRTSDRDETYTVVHELDVEPDYTLYTLLKAPMSFRGKDKDEITQYVGVALGYKRVGAYHVVHFSANHLIVEKVRHTDKATERTFVAASTLAAIDLSRWVEMEFVVTKDTLRVRAGDIELLGETKIPDADFHGPIALIFRTGSEIQFRWVDVAAAKPPQPRAGVLYDSKNNAWSRSGKLEPIDGGAAATPDGASWATIKAPGRAYEIETSLAAITSGPGYALIFFEAFDRHCAFAIGLNEKNQEKMSVGLFGDLKGRFIYYSNNDHFIQKPGNLSFKKKNRYKIVVLPSSVEVWANGDRVFIENKDAFVQKIDYAKGVGDKNGVKPRTMNVGLGAWDISGRDTRSIKAEFTDFVIRVIR